MRRLILYLILMVQQRFFQFLDFRGLCFLDPSGFSRNVVRLNVHVPTTPVPSGAHINHPPTPGAADIGRV